MGLLQSASGMDVSVIQNLWRILNVAFCLESDEGYKHFDERLFNEYRFREYTSFYQTLQKC